MPERRNVREAEFDEGRNPQSPIFGDVAERGAAGVAIVGGVGQRAYADAVEYDPNDAVELRYDCCSLAALANSSIGIWGVAN